MTDARTDWMVATFRDRSTMAHERYYRYPIERVWEAVTNAELSGRPWFSLGGPATKALDATLVASEPPGVVEYTSDSLGAVRIELSESHHRLPYGHIDDAEGVGTHLWLLHSLDPPWAADVVAGLHEFLDQLGLWLDGHWSADDNEAYHHTGAGRDQRTRWVDFYRNRIEPEAQRVGTEHVVMTARGFVRRDERILVSLDAHALTQPELADDVMRLAPEQRAAASFVHFPGDADAPQLVEVWIPPDLRVEPGVVDVHGIGFILGGEMHLDGTALGVGSSFFVPRGVGYSYRAGPQGLTLLGLRPARPLDDGLTALHGGWAANPGPSDGGDPATLIRTVRAEERTWDVLQDRARGNAPLEEIVRALPPDERVTASFVHHRGSTDEPQLIEVWMPPGIRIAPFTQEVHTVSFSLWGPNAGTSNSGRPGVASQPFQVGPQGASSIGFRPIRPPHLTVHTVHGGP